VGSRAHQRHSQHKDHENSVRLPVATMSRQRKSKRTAVMVGVGAAWVGPPSVPLQWRQSLLPIGAFYYRALGYRWLGLTGNRDTHV